MADPTHAVGRPPPGLDHAPRGVGRSLLGARSVFSSGNGLMTGAMTRAACQLACRAFAPRTWRYQYCQGGSGWEKRQKKLDSETNHR